MKKIVLYALIVVLWPLTAHAWTGRVVGVVDGDSLRILHPVHGEIEARLYGIDAPEFTQPFGRSAKKHLRALLAGKKVDIQTMDRDGYGRPVVVVRLHGAVINERMVRDGYAWVYRHYCRETFCNAWLHAENQARAAKLGLWRQNRPQAPWDFRRAQKL